MGRRFLGCAGGRGLPLLELELAVGFGVGLLCRLQRFFLLFGRALEDFLLLLGVFLHQLLLFPGRFGGLALIFRHAHLLSAQRGRAQGGDSHEGDESEKAFHGRFDSAAKPKCTPRSGGQAVWGAG